MQALGNSLFSKIIRGELPCFKIYEDEHTFAFLDIFPVRPGHTLIVPKLEIDYFADLPEPFYSAVYKTAKIISPALLAATGAKRIGQAVVGFEVPHFHLHLIPLSSMEEFSFARKAKADAKNLAVMQERIVSALKY